MRATAILVISTAALVSHTAVAHVKRLTSIPEAFWGTWAPSAEVCKGADKSVIVLSAGAYVSPEANCRVASVSETAGPKGPIYSAHLRCSKPAEKDRKTQSDVILSLKAPNQISLGSRFSNLKDYQRCSTNEPAPVR